RPEDLGIPKTLPHSLRALPIEERPYASAARKHGMTEGDVVALVGEMLEKGILGDPGAALEGRLAGFKENGMVVMEPAGCSDEDELELCNCAAKFPYSTHVVWREAYPRDRWRHICYFMVHATTRERIEQARLQAQETCKPRDSMVLYSLEDLKPHTVR
ncbi:MAG: Lrp/AsnC family transcriptional regulator, partial [Desulfurococcales archaeon]|nr:Lrp/AsnC family transcriptional regulator [Desulfurococcales archaeon]